MTTVEASVEQALHKLGESNFSSPPFKSPDSDRHEEFSDPNCPSEEDSNIQQQSNSLLGEPQ